MKMRGQRDAVATKQVNINGKTSNKRQQKQQQAGHQAEKILKMELKNAKKGKEE